jgi:hypothetical protein
MLMLLVAVVAAGMGGSAQYRRLRRLGQEFEARARLLEEEARTSQFLISQWNQWIEESAAEIAEAKKARDAATEEVMRQFWSEHLDAVIARRERLRRAIESEREKLEGSLEKARRSRRAARYPWLLGAPDQSEPIVRRSTM